MAVGGNPAFSWWLSAALAMGLAALPRRAPAAEGPPASPAAPQAPPASAPYFIYLRYGHHSPEYAFVAYSFGRPGVIAGLVAEADAGYDEALAGAGLNFYTPSGNGASFYALGSRATDSWYVELYATPAATTGRASISAFAGAYVPLEDSGAWQALLDPLTAVVRLGSRLAVGGSYSWYKIAGAPVEQGLGPALQVAIPRGSITVEALGGLAHFRDEVRVTVQLQFE